MKKVVSLILVLIMGLSLAFSVNAETSENISSNLTVDFQFMSYPTSLDMGADVPLALKVLMPNAIEATTLNVAIELNGERKYELDSSLVVSHEEIIYFNIPGTYTNADKVKFGVKILAYSNEEPAKSCGSIEVNIPMTGPLAQSMAEVASLVKPVIITAYVYRDAPAYDYGSLTGYRTTIPKGSYVAYLNPDNHNSMRAAKVRTQSGAIYWVPMNCIWISNENYTIADTLSNEQKEYFVNSRGYKSKTPYLVWVNLERQILCVFLGEQGSWKLVNCFPVASGKNTTPTPTVEHEIEYVTRWVTTAYTCYPVLALYDGYALHNQPVSPSGYVTDNTIGNPASAGCVRMLQKDINWVHAYVPVKTNVVIY